jgi:hypothetical protein
MLRIAILILLAVAVAILVMRLSRSPTLRARLTAITRHPFVRQILVGVVLRIIRLLIFRR